MNDRPVVKGWLSRQRDGNYVLTQRKPELAKIGSTDQVDFYVPIGDAIGFRFICPWAAKAIFGVESEILESTPVFVTGGSRGPTQRSKVIR